MILLPLIRIVLDTTQPVQGPEPHASGALTKALHLGFHCTQGCFLCLVDQYTPVLRERSYILFDPSTGRWTRVGVSAFGQYRDYGTSILLPLQNSYLERGKVMVLGGSVAAAGPTTNIVEIHDFNQVASTSPNIRTVGPLNRSKSILFPIILPDGKVVIFGGSAQANGASCFLFQKCLILKTKAKDWVEPACGNESRVYLGTAVLLPDGHVCQLPAVSTRNL